MASSRGQASKERLLEYGDDNDDFAASFRRDTQRSVSRWWKVSFIGLLLLDIIIAATWALSSSPVRSNTLWG